VLPHKHVGEAQQQRVLVDVGIAREPVCHIRAHTACHTEPLVRGSLEICEVAAQGSHVHSRQTQAAAPLPSHTACCVLHAAA
jgi:hypothetical protein